MREELEILRQSEQFQSVIKDIKAERPTIPAFDYSSDNTEEWKAASQRQIGFDFCLALFGEEV